MQRFVLTWFASSLALSFAAWLLGDHMTIGDSDVDTVARVVSVLLVGLVFTVINSFVAPIVKVLSLPFIVLTLGLALLVINALLLLLASAISDSVGLNLTIDGFWWAVVASIVISLAQSVVNGVVGTHRQ